MATIIGKLAVVVSANTAGIVSGLGKATSALKSFATTAASVATGMVAANALTGGVKGLVDFAANTFSSVDAVGDLAEKLGVGVEALSALQHAATMTDVDVESLNTGLGMFVKTMGKAGKSTDDLLSSFADVADQVARTNGVVEQGKIAYDNFGKGGLALLPLLRKGRSGIEELAKEAKDLGVAFNAVDVAKVGDADNAIKRMKASIKGIGATLAAAFSPMIETVAKFSTNLFKVLRPLIKAVTDQLTPAFEKFSSMFKEFTTADLVSVIEPFALALAGFADAAVKAGKDFTTGFIIPILEGVRALLIDQGGGLSLLEELRAAVEVPVARITGGREAAAAAMQGHIDRMSRLPGAGNDPIANSIDKAIKTLRVGADAVGTSMATTFVKTVFEKFKNPPKIDFGHIGGWPWANLLLVATGAAAQRATQVAKPEPQRDATLVSPFIVQAAMGWARAAEIAFGPKKPSSELGDALVKGSKEALSFVNRFRAGGDDIQKKQLDGDMRREKALDRIDKNIEDVKNNLDDEADI